MNFQSLFIMIKDETVVEEYLRSSGILKSYRHCPKCTTEKPGRIRRGRYKCYRCKAEWSIRSGSFLETTSITFAEFLLCIKFFELEIGVYKTADELGLTHKVVSKVFNQIRISILADEERFDDNTPIKTQAPLMMINSTSEVIKVSLVKSNEKKSLASNQSLIIGRRKTDSGKTIYYDFNCKHQRSIKRIGKSNIPQDVEVNRFWSYAIEKLISLKASTIGGYYLYLKELEFRYNNRSEDLFALIIKKLAK